MNLNEAKKILNDNGYIIAEDTETNDDEIEDLANKWRDKHNNRASDTVHLIKNLMIFFGKEIK